MALPRADLGERPGGSRRSELRAALRELLPAALHGGQELAEVRLERGQDLVGVVLGAEAHLALALPGRFEDLRRLPLGEADDLLLGASRWAISRASWMIRSASRLASPSIS